MLQIRAFILKNSNIGGSLPLSVYLTSLLENFHHDETYALYTITGPAELQLPRVNQNVARQYHISASLYSVPGNIGFALSSAKILIQEHRLERIDLLHCFYPNSSLLGAVLFKLLTGAKTQILYDVRSPWIEMIFAMNHLPRWLYFPVRLLLHSQEAILLRFVDHLMVVSKGLGEYYRETYRLHKNFPVSVLGSAVDVKRFVPKESGLRERLGLESDCLLIGYTGTFSPSRRLDDFFRLFAAATAGRPDVHLVMVGSGQQEQHLRELAAILEIIDRVHFLGAHPFDAMPEIISGFDIGLCHYPDELVYRYNHPLKILEFLACGIPVLASNTPAHRELAESIPSIKIYDTAVSLENAIASMDGKPADVRALFGWDKSIEVYEELYAKLASQLRTESEM